MDADVRVVSSNRGRDIGAFLVDCNDVLTSGEYDIVVKIHSKKSVQDDYNAAQLFKEHLYDNLLASSDHVAGILAEFAAHPGLGMAIAPMPHMGYPTMGHAWFANRAPAREFAKKVGITVPFDDHQPLAPYGSMFIARPGGPSSLLDRCRPRPRGLPPKKAATRTVPWRTSSSVSCPTRSCRAATTCAPS